MNKDNCVVCALSNLHISVLVLSYPSTLSIQV